MTDSAPVAPLRLRPRDRDAIVSSLRAGVVPAARVRAHPGRPG